VNHTVAGKSWSDQHGVSADSVSVVLHKLTEAERPNTIHIMILAYDVDTSYIGMT
jgi:hypothetical protein